MTQRCPDLWQPLQGEAEEPTSGPVADWPGLLAAWNDPAALEKLLSRLLHSLGRHGADNLHSSTVGAWTIPVLGPTSDLLPRNPSFLFLPRRLSFPS